MIITDLRREFVEQLCYRAVQCNAIYEGRYLLGTSLARPVIARAQMKVAAEEGCKLLLYDVCRIKLTRVSRPIRLPRVSDGVILILQLNKD